MRTFFVNGKFFTGKGSFADTLVASDGIVEFIGSKDEAPASSDGAELVDLGGACCLPSFVDAHAHLLMLGQNLQKTSFIACRNSEDFRILLRKMKDEKPGAQRLLGCSWLFDALDSGTRPTKEFIDEIVPDIPVYLDSNDLHSTWLNTAALKELGIDESTPDPKGGSYERDSNGRLTGLLLETPVMEKVWPFLASVLTDAERVEALETVFHAYLATGVTGVVDMALGDDEIRALEDCYKKFNNRLPIRVAAHWLISPIGSEEDRLERVHTALRHRERLAAHAPWLRIVGIKIISDGVIDSCTAFMKEPYADMSRPGPIWTYDELLPIITLADQQDLQVAVHAIGDAASEMALDVFEKVLATNGERPLRRHRIEHLESVTKESIARMARLGITASLQPVHADPVVVPNWRAMLGNDERCDRAFPWTEFVEAKVPIALGTDAPTAPHHSLPNLYIATTRRSALQPDMPYPPKDERLKSLERFKLPLDLAIIGATAGGAHSCHNDKIAGSLQKGLWADFCVLSIDPFKDGVQTLAKAQESVKETWVQGVKVFSR
ncbi:amidohydrolase 3 [Meredithblackwellia eburnea MCA 4105]